MMAHPQAVRTRSILESIHDSAFFFEAALSKSVDRELESHTESDLGPTDSIPAHLRQLELDLFFGNSPLSSLPTSTSSSRSVSPQRSAITASVPPPRTTPLPPNAAHTKVKANSQQRRNKEQSREIHRIKRKKKRDSTQAQPYQVRSSTIDNHITRAVPMNTDTQIDLRAASSGFVGVRDRKRKGEAPTLRKLLDIKKFACVQWDGRTSMPITEAGGRIIAVLVGTPEAPDWEEVHQGAFETIISSRGRCAFPKKALKHRRGDFPALAFGVSHGNGQRRPGNLFHKDPNAHELSQLRSNTYVSRIAGSASAAFAAWAPKLFSYYEEHFHALLEQDPTLRRNFLNSIWAATTVNFGPRTVTRRHRDSANLPYGWCAVMALGEFDATKGGHLVLWDLKLVVEFPAGSTVLLPSAAIAHSNVPIDKHERHCSFTQYTAGALFRWVERGFQKLEHYLAELGDGEREEEVDRGVERCKFGLSLFSTLKTLPEDLAARGVKCI